MTQEPVYLRLTILAKRPDTEIWLGDDEGHFVQKDTGTLSTSLLEGTYVVEFGLGSSQYEIALNAESYIEEAKFAERAPTRRRVPRIPD